MTFAERPRVARRGRNLTQLFVSLIALGTFGFAGAAIVVFTLWLLAGAP
jgi:hypothetical protein